MKIDFITDKNGRHKSVIIPHKQWKNFEADYIRIKNKLKVLTGIQDAVKEVKQLRNGKSKQKTLKELINEL